MLYRYYNAARYSYKYVLSCMVSVAAPQDIIWRIVCPVHALYNKGQGWRYAF